MNNRKCLEILLSPYVIECNFQTLLIMLLITLLIIYSLYYVYNLLNGNKKENVEQKCKSAEYATR